MNSQERRLQRVGEWMREYGLEAQRAILWPMEPSLSASLLEDAGVETLVGLSPGGYPLPNHNDNIEVENNLSHDYGGTDFDLEYGWAVADDITRTIEPVIDPKDNLHTYDYSDLEERDNALDIAFSRLTDTTDRFLGKENSAVLYNLESINRYELPDLAESSQQNQIEYGERIAAHLEERGFESEVIPDPEYSRNVHVIGLR